MLLPKRVKYRKTQKG
ncbi:MAG: hypothetical protein ACPG4Y_04100, partial [Chitinophagales bacterium]